MAPIAFFVVGHADWGKSETLRYLVGNSRHRSWITWENFRLFVRHMSNDDQPETFYSFLNDVDPTWKPWIVLPMCPNSPTEEPRLHQSLRSLTTKGYTLIFWVLIHQFNSDAAITQAEMKPFEKIGRIIPYEERTDAMQRAAQLKTDILRVLSEH